MDTTKQYKRSRLSFPVGTWENPINLDGKDDGSRTKTFKSTSTYGKATRRIRGHQDTKRTRVVIDLEIDTSNALPDFHRQPLNVDPKSKKRSLLKMAESGGLKDPSTSTFPPPRAPERREPYAKRPLPRFPRARIFYKRNEEGRFVRKRKFGNYPHTVPDRNVQASWEAHIRKRATKRMRTGGITSGREKLRLEMTAEEDLSLSQGDVSKKGRAIPFKLAKFKST